MQLAIVVKTCHSLIHSQHATSKCCNHQHFLRSRSLKTLEHINQDPCDKDVGCNVEHVNHCPEDSLH